VLHRRSHVIQLGLTKEEAAALVKALEYYVSELRMEVSDTEQKDMRDALKIEESTLKKILRSLKQESRKARSGQR
jgi:DNA-binding MarR family transcriptional regulator